MATGSTEVQPKQEPFYHKVHVMTEFLKLLIDKYGQAVLGLVILLTLWLVMLQPMWNKNSVDFTTNLKIIEALNENNRTQRILIDDLRHLAETIKTSAELIERTISTKLDNQNAIPRTAP